MTGFMHLVTCIPIILEALLAHIFVLALGPQLFETIHVASLSALQQVRTALHGLSPSPEGCIRMLQARGAHPYRINPEVYRASSSGSTGAHVRSGPWHMQHLVRLIACLVSPSLSMHTQTQYSAFDPFIGHQASSQPCVDGGDEMWSDLIKVVDRGPCASQALTQQQLAQCRTMLPYPCPAVMTYLQKVTLTPQRA